MAMTPLHRAQSGLAPLCEQANVSSPAVNEDASRLRLLLLAILIDKTGKKISHQTGCDGCQMPRVSSGPVASLQTRTNVADWTQSGDRW